MNVKCLFKHIFTENVLFKHFANNNTEIYTKEKNV